MKIKKVIKSNSIEYTLNLLNQFNNNAEIIAGGTDVIVNIKDNKNNKFILIDITSIKEMSFIRLHKNKLSIGALTTFDDIVKNSYIKHYFYGLWKACKLIGSPQIRNRATLGGNICNGSMAADSIPPLLSLDANLIIKSKYSIRTVKLKDFFKKDNTVDLQDNEMLINIDIDLIELENTYTGFEKFGLRNSLAISRISNAVFLKLNKNNYIENIRIASGSLAIKPIREFELEEYLKGRILNEDLLISSSNKFSNIIEKRLSKRSSCPFKKEAIKGVFKKSIYNALNGGINNGKYKIKNK